MLRDMLTEAGYEVIAEAVDGDQAVTAFREHSPDLVTLDIVMPRKSGLEALREIVALEPAARVVMCSALGQEALVMEALESGATDFIVKPFKPDQALGVIEKALNKE
jgi:two-component system chemotaxis response regulator CheY